MVTASYAMPRSSLLTNFKVICENKANESPVKEEYSTNIIQTSAPQPVAPKPVVTPKVVTTKTPSVGKKMVQFITKHINNNSTKMVTSI